MLLQQKHAAGICTTTVKGRGNFDAKSLQRATATFSDCRVPDFLVPAGTGTRILPAGNPYPSGTRRRLPVSPGTRTRRVIHKYN